MYKTCIYFITPILKKNLHKKKMQCFTNLWMTRWTVITGADVWKYPWAHAVILHRDPAWGCSCLVNAQSVWTHIVGMRVTWVRWQNGHHADPSGCMDAESMNWPLCCIHRHLLCVKTRGCWWEGAGSCAGHTMKYEQGRWCWMKQWFLISSEKFS